jgi:hypothetical protein
LDEDPTAVSGSRMTVRELLAWLEDKDPDFLVLIDSNAQSLIVVNPRQGFCSLAELDEERRSLTAQDQEFLRNMHIKA